MLLKLLALGDRDIEQGNIAPIEEVVERIRGRVQPPEFNKLGLRAW